MYCSMCGMHSASAEVIYASLIHCCKFTTIQRQTVVSNEYSCLNVVL